MGDDRPPVLARFDPAGMQMAVAVAEHRSGCARYPVGAAIHNLDTGGWTVGANGPPRDATCTGVEGACGCIHAETRALARALPGRKVVYLTHSPCEPCGLHLAAAHVVTVHYRHPYRLTAGLRELDHAHIPHRQSTDS